MFLKPYLSLKVDMVSIASQFSLVIVLLCALLLKVDTTQPVRPATPSLPLRCAQSVCTRRLDAALLLPLPLRHALCAYCGRCTTSPTLQASRPT